MYNAIDIAQWFVNRAASDVNGNNGGEYLTHLKLQKLLYYAQGANLALNDEPLFNESIKKWAHGPVVSEVYRVYKKYKDGVIDNVKDIEVDYKTENVLEQVYEVFGAYSALKLREMTHNETPWQSVNLNEEISNETIQQYFKENYLEE